MNHLVPCPECNRHVRVSERECPFCALPLDLSATPEPRLPRERLSRAATLAFGATLASATALVDCGNVVPIYGAPAPAGGSAGVAGAAGSTAPAAGSGGSGAVVPVYGAPAGGGFGTGNAGSGNAGSGGGGPVPVYGAAP